jgi:hypothetical protein
VSIRKKKDDKKRDLMHFLLNGVARNIFEEQVYVARLLTKKKLKKIGKKNRPDARAGQ